MPRWLPGLTRRGVELETKAASDRRASQGPFYTAKGMPYVSNWDIDRIVRDGYEKVIWVFKAIDANAEKLSSWPIRCYDGSKDDPDRKVLTDADEPLLQILNARANMIDGPAKYFRYRVYSQLILSKKGVFVEVIPTRGGQIGALNLLPPGRTDPLPDPDKFLGGFRVTLGDGEIFDLPVYDPKKRRGVLWIRKPHPTNPYSSVTPLEAAGISIDLDFYARLYNRNFLLNDGRAGQIVAVKGGLSDEDAQELKQRFQPGLGGVGRTTVIEADAISVQDTAVSPRDAQYAELRSITKEDLLIALGTPESVIGNASGRTFDNADAEKENWLEDTVVPLGGVAEAGWEVLTEGGYDDDRFLEHDTSREPVLQRVKERKQNTARADYAAGNITLEELRHVLEMDPIDGPGTDVIWLAVNGKAPTSSDPNAKAAAEELKLLMPPTPGADGTMPPPDGGEPADPNAPDLFGGGGSAADGGGDGSLDPTGADQSGGDGSEPLALAAAHSGYGWKDAHFTLELKDGWADADAVEPFEVKAHNPSNMSTNPASFSWDENKVKRDAKGRFAHVASKGLAHILEFPAGYPFAKVEGAPPATPLPAKKKIKVGSLRKGDVIAEHDVKDSPLWTVAQIGKVPGPPQVGEGTDAKVQISLVNVDGEKKTLVAPTKNTGAFVVARTPHPAVVAQAKKDKAASAAPIAGPHIVGVKAAGVQFGDILVDAKGDQWTVTNVVPNAANKTVTLSGKKDVESAADEVQLGVFSDADMLTLKTTPELAAAGVAAEPPPVWNTENPSPFAGAYKYTTTAGDVRVLKVGHAGYGTLYDESGSMMSGVSYKPDEIGGVIAKLPAHEFSADLAAYDAPTSKSPKLLGMLGPSGFPMHGSHETKPGEVYVRQHQPSPINPEASGQSVMTIQPDGSAMVSDGTGSPPFAVSKQDVADELAGKWGDWTQDTSFGKGVDKQPPGTYTFTATGEKLVVGHSGMGIVLPKDKSVAQETLDADAVNAALTEDPSQWTFEPLEWPKTTIDGDPILPGHYSDSNNEGFTVAADGSATWDDGTPMLSSYLQVAVGTKKPDSWKPTTITAGTYKAADGTTLEVHADGTGTFHYQQGKTAPASGVDVADIVGSPFWTKQPESEPTFSEGNYETTNGDKLIVNVDGSGTLMPQGAVGADKIQALSPKMVESHLLGGSWTKVEPPTFDETVAKIDAVSAKEAVGTWTVDGHIVHVDADGSVTTADSHFPPDSIFAKGAIAKVKAGEGTKVQEEHTADSGRYVHSSGKILTVYIDGSGQLVGAHGNKHNLSIAEVNTELAKPGWSQATEGAPDEPPTFGEGAPPGVYGTPVLAGKMVIHEDGTWSLLKPNGAQGAKHALEGVAPKPQWTYEGPLPAAAPAPQGVVGAGVSKTVQSGVYDHPTLGKLVYDADSTQGTLTQPNGSREPINHATAASLILGAFGQGSTFTPTGQPAAVSLGVVEKTGFAIAAGQVWKGNVIGSDPETGKDGSVVGEWTLTINDDNTGTLEYDDGSAPEEVDATSINAMLNDEETAAYLSAGYESALAPAQAKLDAAAEAEKFAAPLTTGVTKKASELHLGDTIEVAGIPVTVTSVGPSHEPGAAGMLAVFGKPAVGDALGNIPGSDPNITDVYGAPSVATTHPDFEFPTYASAATPELAVPVKQAMGTPPDAPKAPNGYAIGTYENTGDAIHVVVEPNGYASVITYPEFIPVNWVAPPGTQVTKIEQSDLGNWLEDTHWVSATVPPAISGVPAPESVASAKGLGGAQPGDIFWQKYADGSLSKLVVQPNGTVKQWNWGPYEYPGTGDHPNGKLEGGGAFSPENYVALGAAGPPIKSPYPPPPVGAIVYQHPQGKVIYVHADNVMEVWGPDGKKKTSSATPENLAWGHGTWQQVFKIPGWTQDSATAEWHPDVEQSAAPTAAAPPPPSLPTDVGPDKVFVTSGQLSVASDNTVTLHADGTATFHDASDVYGSHELTAEQVTGLLESESGGTHIWIPSPDQTYKDSYGNQLVIHPDGHGTIHYANGSSDPVDLTVGDTKKLVVLPGWKAAPAEVVTSNVPDQGTGSSYNQLGNTPDDLLAAATPEQKELLALLDYPADYPWPQVPGLVPATVKPPTGSVKPNSARVGDVADLSKLPSVGEAFKGQGGTLGTPGTITKSKKLGNGTWQFQAVMSDGKTVSFGLNDGEELPVLARTPHPSKVAAAKKLKKQLLEGPASFTPAGQPGPKAPGVYTSPGTTLAITVDAAGHATWTKTTEGGSSPDAAGLMNPNEVLTSGIGEDFTFVPSTPAPEPTTGFLATGPVLSEKTAAAAKAKSVYSAVVKNGGVIILPLGGSMTVTGSKYVPSKPKPGGGYRPGGFVLVGVPSADINPVYLTGDNEATYNSAQGGTLVQWIPKAALGKKGATLPSPATVAAPTPAPTPAATPVGQVVNPGINGPSSTAGWVKVGPQAGSNPGGKYEAPDKTQYYVKAPATAMHAENEKLAADLYTAAGVPIPQVSLVGLAPELGLPASSKLGIASAIVAGKKNLPTAYTDPEYRAKIVDGFAVDAWLANWDAVGTGKDNIIQVAGGAPLRVDVGGSLLYRAQGTPKGIDFGPTVTETKTLLDSSKNPDAAAVYGKVTKAEMAASVQKHIAPITEGQIDALVESTMKSMSAEDRAHLKTLLKARRKDIAKQAGVVLPEDKPAPKTPTVHITASGAAPLPYQPGMKVTHDQVTLDGKDLWWHTTTIGATVIGPGNVVFLDDDASAPYVVTKIAEKVKGAPSPKGGVVGDGGIGKMGVWGKRNGTGPEVFMFVQVTSQGERQVHVQVEAPPGWSPPPPPPPPTPGVKLELTAKDMASNHSPTTGATAALQQINNSSNRTVQLKKAFKLATPEQHVALASVGLDDPDSFASHFGGGLSSSWDGSSNNGTSLLAFHHAVAIEFGLDDVAPWGDEQKNMKTKQAVAQYFAKYGSAYQAAARLIYQNTQNELKAKGIKYIKITRTVAFQPPQSAKGGYGKPAPPWAWTNGIHDDVTLRPLSSFSWGVKHFGDTKIQGVVPVEMIFSINSTGPGTDYEQEIVPLGVGHFPWTISGAVSPGAGYTKEQYLKDFPEWKPGTSTLAPNTKSWFDDGPNAYGAGPYPSLASEDWLKGDYWPYVDEDGDDVIGLAELLDLYPDVIPWQLLDMPVGQAMPPQLREELLDTPVDDDDRGPFSSEYLPAALQPAAAAPAEQKNWVGL